MVELRSSCLLTPWRPPLAQVLMGAIALRRTKDMQVGGAGRAGRGRCTLRPLAASGASRRAGARARCRAALQLRSSGGQRQPSSTATPQPSCAPQLTATSPAKRRAPAKPRAAAPQIGGKPIVSLPSKTVHIVEVPLQAQERRRWAAGSGRGQRAALLGRGGFLRSRLASQPPACLQ